MFLKRILSIIFLSLLLFSCTTKEEKVRQFVENQVVTEAQDHLIRQAILNYAKNDALDVFVNRIKYYSSNPYHDYSTPDKEINRPFWEMEEMLYGKTKKEFEKRWGKLSDLYTWLTYETDIEFGLSQLDTTLRISNFLHETPTYTIEEIADIYFKPNHMKFTEITPDLYNSIYRSMLCLGASTYNYDVVDEIRVKPVNVNEELYWNVDLVYHSGYCMPLSINYNKEKGFFVTAAPWLAGDDAGDYY